MRWQDLPKEGRKIAGVVLGAFFAYIVVTLVWFALPTHSCYPEASLETLKALQCRHWSGHDYSSYEEFLAGTPATFMYVLGLVSGAIFS